MKITKSQLKRIIKEELQVSLSETDGSFFGGEEEASLEIYSKQEFRSFRDLTNELLDSLGILQNEKDRFIAAVSPHGVGAGGTEARHAIANWQRMLGKLISGLKRNLEIVSGAKGTHSGAEPLAEAGFGQGGNPPTPTQKSRGQIAEILRLLTKYHSSDPKYVSRRLKKYIQRFHDLTTDLWGDSLGNF